MFNKKVLLSTLALSISCLIPANSAHANVYSAGGGWACNTWQVYTSGVLVNTGTSCFYDEMATGSTGGGSGGGSGSSGESGGGGGGGGGGGFGSGEGTWFLVDNGDFKALVNTVKNEVKTSDMACSALIESRMVVASRILVKNPWLSASKTVTVYFSDGKQTFQRTGPAFSDIQMQPTSGCGA